MKRLLAIRTGRQPHEICICICALLVGLTGLTFGESISASISAALPPPWRTVYFAGLVISGAVALYGIWRHDVMGVLVERVGMWTMGALFAAFSGAILLLYGWSGLAAALMPLCFSTANAARAVQIGRDLALLMSYLADHPHEGRL